MKKRRKALGISLSTVKRQWILARIKLFRLIQEQNG